MITDKGALNLIDLFYQNNIEAYAVGGCVRDTLLLREVSDIDITVSCTPDITVSVLDNNGIRYAKTGIKHGTVTAITQYGVYEITTFRTDGDYNDNRHPDTVNFVSDIKQDLSRRDFTVNAMAFNTKSGLVDLFGGKSDLHNKLIRAVGDPDTRFKEDALRILRALRFASVLGFEIEPSTASAIHRNKHLLDNIARERILAELQKLLCGTLVTKIITDFSDVFETVLPILNNISKKHAWQTVADSVEKSPINADVRLALLLYYASELDKDKKLEKSACNLAVNSLKLKKTSSRLILFLVENANVEIKSDRYELKKLMFELGKENVVTLVKFKKALGEALQKAESEIESIITSDEAVTLLELKVNGNDMITFGFKDQAIADTLTDILHHVMRGKLSNNKEEIYKFMNVNIRKATMDDFDRICEIYAIARQFMKNNGNPTQWGDKNPPIELVRQNLIKDITYVCEKMGKTLAVFTLNDCDPSYERIDDGNWLDNGNYGVIHSVASDGTVKGVTGYIMDFCKMKFDNLRGDTHEDNKPMQRVFEKNGFVRCGTVYAANGTPRIAYQYLKK